MVVVSGDGQVKAYRLTSSGKTAPKEEGSWVGVAEALVGDFANLNREQLLLLLSSDGIHLKFPLGMNFSKISQCRERCSWGVCAD